MKHITLHIVKNTIIQDYLKYIPENFEVVQHDDVLTLLKNINRLNIPLIDCSNLREAILPMIDYLKNVHNRLIFFHREDSSIVIDDLDSLGMIDFLKNGQIMIIADGEFNSGIWANLETMLYQQVSDNYNIRISSEYFEKIYTKKNKPYKFNCLNNIERWHRNKLLEELERNDLLSMSLWTYITKNHFLPDEYADFWKGTRVFVSDSYDCDEVRDIRSDEERKPIELSLVLLPELYEDTYFSVVTETNYLFPASARSEKIYKPIFIGHPFIAVSNFGFYKSLKNMGFKTFNKLIDESFDDIEDNDLRMKKVVNSIKDLCSQNLDSFLEAAKEICIYNRNHLIEIGRNQDKNHKEELARFFSDISELYNKD